MRFLFVFARKSMSLKVFSIGCVFTIFLSVLRVEAQSSLIRYSDDKSYQKAIVFFEEGQYAIAGRYFGDYLTSQSDTLHPSYVNACYYDAVCAVQSGDLYGLDRLEGFITRHPDHAKTSYACFYLANAYYSQGDYGTAVSWYEQISSLDLKPQDEDEYCYKKGYCYWQAGNREKARQVFLILKAGSSLYAEDASFYLAILNYDKGDYAAALSDFKVLEKTERYAVASSYYIAHIYYEQGQYDQVIESTRHVIISFDTVYRAGLFRVVAASNMKLQKYPSALAYWKAYETEVPEPNPSDHYDIGYTYFAQQQYTEAIPYFQKVMMDSSAMAQNASYHLADCYMRTSDKQKARAAFLRASQMTFDTAVREEAMYHAAVLTYEQSYSPFNDIIKSFSTFIATFPQSSRIQSAHTYLSMAYGATKNYKQAYESLQQADLSSAYMQKTYQRVAFFRGLECYNAQSYTDCIQMMQQSMTYGQQDPTILARSYFWEGEAYSKLHEPQKALADYKKFLSTEATAQITPEYHAAFYGLGYCYFELKSYKAALNWFTQYLTALSPEDPTLGDTYIRIADCYFMAKDYTQAISQYDEAVKLAQADSDYALFQKGFSYGLLSRYDDKIATLTLLMETYPQSAYVDDALYEMGKTYINKQQPEQAITYYKQVENNYPTSSYHSKSLSQLALAYYNLNDSDTALQYYKQVAEQYPQSEDARSALLGIKTIYIDKNELNEYFDYVAQLGNQVHITISEQDSLTYLVAENLYREGNREKAIAQMNGYLTRFPDGAFVLNANYYLADCYNYNKDWNQALTHYRYIVSQPRSMFTEQSLMALSAILFNQKQYGEALDAYRQLSAMAEVNSNLVESQLGMVRCYYWLKEAAQTISASQQALKTHKLSDMEQREVQYMMAKSYDQLQKSDSALIHYRESAGEVVSEEGAESKYRVIAILYTQKKYKEAETEVFDFVSKNTPHTYWMAKSFIVLADVYVAMDDLFQAEHTIQSVIDNYEVKDDGILEEAQVKKSAITAVSNPK